MQGIVLGTGPSLKAYKRANHGNCFVIGANDIYSYEPDIDAVGFVDVPIMVKNSRPNYLQTPLHIPTYVRKYERNTKQAEEIFPGRPFIHVPSSRFNINSTAPIRTNLTEDVQHGSCTPVWLCSILLAFGINEITVYGVDIRGHKSMDNDVRRHGVAMELHRLNEEAERRGGYVALTSASALHEDIKKLDIPKLNSI